MVFSHTDKTTIKKLHQLKGLMRDNWGQNFRTKDDDK